MNGRSKDSREGEFSLKKEMTNTNQLKPTCWYQMSSKRVTFHLHYYASFYFFQIQSKNRRKLTFVFEWKYFELLRIADWSCVEVFGKKLSNFNNIIYDNLYVNTRINCVFLFSKWVKQWGSQDVVEKVFENEKIFCEKI